MLRIRIEDNVPFAAFRWRGVTGEDAAGCAVRAGRGLRGGAGDIVIGSGLPADGAEGFGCVLEGLLRASR
jgi:hypothetical protein